MTGGSRGIGRAIAELFHERGDQVGICSLSGQAPGLPQGILTIRADVRDPEQMRRAAAGLKDRFGALEVLINCAGISRWRPLDQVEEEFAREILETSALGTLWSCAAAARVMSTGGAVVNVSSLAGKRGSANNSVYCAAKFAVNGLTQALAKEWGPRGIRVNAVCPVYVQTDRILASLEEPYAPAAGRPARVYLEEFAATQTALGRLPTAAEVAEVVHFLASSAASAITGQCINVDCGTFPQ